MTAWLDDILKNVLGRYFKNYMKTIIVQSVNIIKPLEERVIIILSIIFLRLKRKFRFFKRFQTELRRNYYYLFYI